MSDQTTEPEKLTEIIAPEGPQDQDAVIAKIVLNGDLSSLHPRQKVQYYKSFCEVLGLNPVTRPFDYIKQDGKITLYANRSCTEQLRKVQGVSVVESIDSQVGDIYMVKVKVQDKTGRTDVGTGAVTTKGSSGKELANVMMRAETKAKRRATLSICGLGVVDEVELDTMPEATLIDPVDCEDKRREIFQLLEDNQGMISDDYVIEITAEVDFAVAENDASGLDVVFDGLKKELKKDRNKETKINMNDTFDGMKKASELDTSKTHVQETADSVPDPAKALKKGAKANTDSELDIF